MNPTYSKNLLFRTPPEEKYPGGSRSSPAATTRTSQDSHETDRVLCRQCHFEITLASEQIAVNGAHSHTYANPHGIVYEISCFGNASGCGTVGIPTNDFTWFAGYFWQVAICSSCLTHLGWRFTGKDKQGFFGLIQDRLLKSSSA